MPSTKKRNASSTGDSPAPRKKAKTTTRKPSAAKGSSAKARHVILSELPLDVFHEIFAHVLPADILNLARTSKQLRRFLMNRSAMAIWRSAIANLPGFPQCPEDMSLPAYISLAFDTFCTLCLAPKARVRREGADWILRIRYCTDCAKGRLEKLHCLITCSNDISTERLQSCIPASAWFLPSRRGDYFLPRDRDRFFATFREVATDKRTEFIRDQRNSVEARKDHAECYKKWRDSVEQRLKKELANVKAKREEAIVERLQELGYTEEIAKLPSAEEARMNNLVMFRDLPEVNQQKPLTDRIWKSIAPKMVEYMEKMKVRRLAKERHELVEERQRHAAAVYCRYKRDHRTDELMPGTVELWDWDIVKQLIDAPVGDGLAPGLFDHIPELIPKWAEDWRSSCSALAEFIQQTPIECDAPPSTLVPADPIQRLKLAVCVHGCKTNIHYSHKKYMFWPESVHHICNWKVSTHWPNRQNEAKRHTNLWLKVPYDQYSHLSHEYTRSAWSPKEVMFDAAASAVVHRIVRACGLDPRVATAAEMDALDPWMACMECRLKRRNDNEDTEVMPWRTALVHCMEINSHRGAPVPWLRISEEDEATARTITRQSFGMPEKSPVWGCSYCRDTSYEFARYDEEYAQKHLDDRHAHEKCGDFQVDCYRALDVPPPERSEVKFVLKTQLPAVDGTYIPVA